MNAIAFPLLLLALGGAAHAGAADCKFTPPAAARGEVAWSGACRDGFAEGQGTLSWTVPGAGAARLEGALAHGEIQGVAKLTRPDGAEYTGTFRDGIPDGKGYFRDANNMQYEGDVRNGERTGMAEGEYPRGDHYVGEWRNGKPHGRGRMEYALGGVYDGEWRDGRRHGHGVLTYAGSGRRFEGEFVDGRIAGSGPRPQADKSYDVRDDRTGSHILEQVARNSPVPPNIGYEAFTPEQKTLFNGYFPALEEGDEPPYPQGGTQEFYKFMSRVTGKFRARGDLFIYVTVGADGKAESVKLGGMDDPELRRVAGTGAGLLKYKPALCHGQPCAMVFPFVLHLETRL